MPSTDPEAGWVQLRWADHAAVLAGGAAGGYLGLLFVSWLVLPDVIHPAAPGDCLCASSIGILAGWLPGFAVSLEAGTRRAGRWAAFGAALAAGAFFTALFAIAVGRGANC